MNTSVPRAPTRPHEPVLRITFYDRLSSFLIAIVLGLFLTVVFVIPAIQGVRPTVPPPPRTVESLSPGGFDDGAPVETLHVDSPEDPLPNASVVDSESLDESVDETLETVIELAEVATQQLHQALAVSTDLERTPGSDIGDKGPPLDDPPGNGAEQRWYVRFNENGSVDEYARQLEFFGIELGALFVDRGELVYLSNLTGAAPEPRVVTRGDDQRLYMNWQGGERRSADVELFERAGIDVTGALLLHFYPARTEEMLARLELSYANRPVEQISRTYFVVVRRGGGYAFAVARQTTVR